ncbi:hypothetical protein [Kingella sp. (in: b-proteobacteria)]|uniref:hypothetical protein n=1 Tax=Kingella sp. (in: b-proteobacteria) TaxID=2020713 RepID=UPI0026DB793A|nr:hypothetical protein [Kingella sp. (in: b-proteobacteria)]MDO4658453.1 hypothetical protein [Kingella sp. (in: b-proteobacteria)]
MSHGCVHTVQLSQVSLKIIQQNHLTKQHHSFLFQRQPENRITHFQAASHSSHHDPQHPTRI